MAGSVSGYTKPLRGIGSSFLSFIQSHPVLEPDNQTPSQEAVKCFENLNGEDDGGGNDGKLSGMGGYWIPPVIARMLASFVAGELSSSP